MAAQYGSSVWQLTLAAHSKKKVGKKIDERAAGRNFYIKMVIAAKLWRVESSRLRFLHN